MEFFSGIKYNIKGVSLALKTPSLLMLGLLRFFVVFFLTLFLSGLILYWHDEILAMIWKAPQGGWLVYVWNIAAWLLSIFLACISMLISYLIAQLFFGVFIMDYMSRITERIVLGKEISFDQGSWLHFFFYLVRQEIPRAILPVIITLFIMLAGLFTPIGPFILVLSSLAAGMFLAWDNTDLIPARRMLPLGDRIKFLKQNLSFHLGFGLLFLIPWLNILFLSFAPVGATLYFIDKENTRNL
ncbi:MAG: EI24 domain-containing protein [Proteobacteria bacterium]|nr:EI24 domain-containing protein [Desulfobacula sp.]MBU3953838.1 EI24 domain-containing protein [Pseudomonadota bacterium]MBU4130848.1 EI24 domain-containing protein [Pseudomonadota bacterium]